MSSSTRYYPTALPSIKAVTLVAHGLNVQPRAMEPLIHWLAALGSVVYLVQLSGHYEKGLSIQEVTSSTWQQEMMEGYTIAQQAAQAHKIPLYFLGYSLGALLGQSMIALSKEGNCFNKQILFAPAIAIRTRSYLIKLLFFLEERTTLPSYTPADYRANERLPLSIYQLLFAEEKKLIEAKFQGLNIPTLIIIDPRDELISYKKLQLFIKKFRLTNYKVVVLNDNRKDRDKSYHHLIINEKTMGAVNWRRTAIAMQQFLFPL